MLVFDSQKVSSSRTCNFYHSVGCLKANFGNLKIGQPHICNDNITAASGLSDYPIIISKYRPPNQNLGVSHPQL